MRTPYTSSSLSSIHVYPQDDSLTLPGTDKTYGITYLLLLTSTLLFLFIVSLDLSAGEGDLIWSYETGGPIRSSPSISPEGTIFVGSDDDKIYALESGERSDDRTKWTYATGGDVVSSPTVGGNGTVYVGSTDGYLYALDSSDGSEVWKFSTGDAVESSPAIGFDGTIYFGSNDGRIYAVDSSGYRKWSYCTEQPVKSSPAIGADGTIYVGSDDGKVYALNPGLSPENRVKWTFDTGGSVEAAPAISSGGTLYVGSTDGYLYALDLGVDPGERLKWKYLMPEGGPVQGSATIGPDGKVFIGERDYYIYALNPGDGSQVDHFALADGYLGTSSSVDKAGRVIFGLGRSTFWAITSADLFMDWVYDPDNLGDISSSPAVSAEGTVYFGSHDGKLYALSNESDGLAATPWPTFQQNVRRTGRASYPVAFDDETLVSKGGSKTVNPLKNDGSGGSGLDSATLTVKSHPDSGTVSPNSDGTVTYSHDGTETAEDNFTYRISNNDGLESNLATVGVEVNLHPPKVSENIPDRTGSDGDSVNLDLSGNFSDPDGDELTFSASGLPRGLDFDSDTGVVSGTITPDASDSSPYYPTVTADDGVDTVDTEFKWTVKNPPPSASDDSYSLPADDKLTLGEANGLITNDRDEDELEVTRVNGESLSGDITLDSGALLTMNSDGSFAYDPSGQFDFLGSSETASDTFTYTVSDGDKTDDAEVTIDVIGTNDPPSSKFTFSPSNPEAGETITFDASESADVDGAIEIYRWDWKNDGSYEKFDPSSTVEHSFPDSGTYTVRLEVEDDQGARSSTTSEVIVVESSAGDGSVFRVTEEGEVHSEGPYHGEEFVTGNADLAEKIQVTEGVEPGHVVSLDPGTPGHYRKSEDSYSTLVAGVVSTRPGMTLSEGGQNDRPSIALVGTVPVKATSENGPIRPGDLLTTSTEPGHAMVCNEKSNCAGAIVGKALESLVEPTGKVKVLVVN